MSNDISIQNASNVPANIQIRTGPVYLISLSQGVVAPYFLATKLDEAVSTVKAVGFFAKRNAKSSDLIENYAALVSSAKPEDMIEVSFPWHQVFSIQNLIYRHKGNK